MVYLGYNFKVSEEIVKTKMFHLGHETANNRLWEKQRARSVGLQSQTSNKHGDHVGH